MSLRARSIDPTNEGPWPETSAATDPWLLDSREVSRVLGIGRTKVFQMMARAELPVVYLGRSVRVPRQALEEWVNNRTRISIRPLEPEWRARARGSSEIGDREL